MGRGFKKTIAGTNKKKSAAMESKKKNEKRAFVFCCWRKKVKGRTAEGRIQGEEKKKGWDAAFGATDLCKKKENPYKKGGVVRLQGRHKTPYNLDKALVLRGWENVVKRKKKRKKGGQMTGAIGAFRAAAKGKEREALSGLKHSKKNEKSGSQWGTL